MAFVFDAVPTSSTHNSYASVEVADDYFTSSFKGGAWSTFDLVKKQSLLVTATNILETLAYGGLRTNRLQPLQWPRQGIYNDEGTPYSSDVLPTKLLQATCEMALWLFSEEDRVLDDVTLLQYENFSAGPLNLKIRKKQEVIPLQVKALITSIGTGTLLGTVTPLSINL